MHQRGKGGGREVYEREGEIGMVNVGQNHVDNFAFHFLLGPGTKVPVIVISVVVVIVVLVAIATIVTIAIIVHLKLKTR